MAGPRLTARARFAGVTVVSAFALTGAVIPGVKSPTGNIRCAATTTVLHCDIGHADYAGTLQYGCMNPHGEMGAGVDWHGFALTRTGKGQVVCSGGVWYAGAPSHYVTLPYGHTWRTGAFTCASRISGMTCTNRRRHGVFVSRGSYRLF